MSSARVPGRTLRRRFTLGSGPLKRTSDRVEHASRLVLALALLLAVPLGLLAGAVAYSSVSATARHEAATRFPEAATLLENSAGSGPVGVSVPTRATWTTPGGATRTGTVNAKPGMPAASTVDIWVDDDGRLTPPPLTEGEAVGQSVVIGVLAVLALVIAGMTGHLVVLWLLERRRMRLWERGWTSVEPLWVSRFR